MGMVWTPIATAMLYLSSLATFLTMLHLRYRWDVRKASVRWLFWLFFAYVWSWCTLRAIYFTWMCLLPHKEYYDEEKKWSSKKIDQLSIHAILKLQDTRKPFVTSLLVAGDVALAGIAVTLFPLTYELWRIARISMDRGVKLEQRQIKRYAIAIHVVLVLFATAQIVLCATCGGYNIYTQRAVLCVYLVQFVGLAFMAVLLVKLKVTGRKYETIHGTFVASPVYQRLKRIMLVYALFSFQFQLSTVVIYFHDDSGSEGVIQGVGVSLIVYNLSGLALAITTSCSQACVFSMCASCLPDDFEAEYLHRRFAGPREAPAAKDLEAPSTNPVFVYTDIESSSALWNIGDGEVMEVATELHDDILRSSLPKHHGYEITTVGDAFQVAFHNMCDAIEYCMDVQLQLLVAKWPKDLHGAVPATIKQRASRRIVFHGLRVRMGIHDALDSEGTLVQDVHAVTGKTTYSGVSEVIADFVGDLGCGGQILVTGRVATWLKHHREELSVDVFMERVGQYTVPQVNMNVEIFQLLPAMLASRNRFFVPPDKGRLRQNHEPRVPSSRRMRRRRSQMQILPHSHVQYSVQYSVQDSHASSTSPRHSHYASLDSFTFEPRMGRQTSDAVVVDVR